MTRIVPDNSVDRSDTSLETVFAPGLLAGFFERTKHASVLCEAAFGPPSRRGRKD